MARPQRNRDLHFVRDLQIPATRRQMRVREYPGHGTPVVYLHGLLDSSEGWHEVAKLLADVEGKPAAEIAKKVMAALDWLQKQPEHRAFALQLQMVALNLKNLK